VAQGQTLFHASGDFGSFFDCGQPADIQRVTAVQPSIDETASSPDLTVVGGSQFLAGGNGINTSWRQRLFAPRLMLRQAFDQKRYIAVVHFGDRLPRDLVAVQVALEQKLVIVVHRLVMSGVRSSSHASAKAPSVRGSLAVEG
jgi:hypothetical protein